MKIMTGETAGIAVMEEGVAVETDQPSRIRRVAGFCGKAAGLGAASALVGVTSLFLTDTKSTLGPHETGVELNLEGTATFDLGVSGSIILPLEDEGGLGAEITVGEIPAEATVEDYARSLASIEDDIEGTKNDLKNEAIKNSLFAGLGLMAAYRFVGKKRMGEHLERMQGKWATSVATGLIAVNLSVAGFVGLGEISAAEDVGVPADPIFEGTPLEHARLTGYMPQIVNGFGREVIDLWRENDTFYDRVLVNLATAFEEQRVLSVHEDYPIMLFYTDLHCNVGMAQVIGEAARLSGAELGLDGGDTTIGGSEIEEYCIQTLSSEVPDIYNVTVGGNHDGTATEAQQRKHGFKVLDNNVIELMGIRILGDDDVMRSEFGKSIELEASETTEELSIRLAETACSDPEGVDILLVHQAEAAAEALRLGCVQTVLSGHVHHEELVRAPRGDGSATFELTGDNASGATGDQPSLGPVDEQSPARFYLLKFDRENGRVINYQTVTIFSDASVELSDIIFVPPVANG